MAPTSLEAESMIAASAAAKRVLAIGLIRRFLPAAQTIRSYLAQGVLGDVQAFHFTEGGRFRWPTRSADYFQPTVATGGVLADIGTHVLDLIVWWLGEPKDVRYEDDAMGGVELNCRVDLRFPGGVNGVVRLSRDCDLPSRCFIRGTRGWLLWSIETPERPHVAPGGNASVVSGRLHELSAVPSQPGAGRRVANFEQSFVEQLRNVVASVRGEELPFVGGQEGLAAVRLVEYCYRHRTVMPMGWLNEREKARAENSPGRARSVRVAVLGASGFIGSRLVERFHLEGIAEVRPIARRVASLAGPSRFRLDSRIADGFDREALAEAFADCEIVVHAVAGAPWVILGTLEPANEAAQRAGVRRLVYLSCASVHGQTPARGTTEESALSDRQAIPYNSAKVRADRRLRRLRARGTVELVLLRPGIVFGPRSTWVSSFADALLEGTANLVERGRGICNSLYVDNLIEGIRGAMRAPGVDGEAFLLGDRERMTWADLYRPIAAALGFDLESIRDAVTLRASRLARGLLRRARRSPRAGRLHWCCRRESDES